MSNVPIIGERLDWSSAIGLFLLNFGTLDYLVFVFLKDNLEPTAFTTFQKRGLKERVERIIQFLKAAKYPSSEQDRFASWASRFETVRGLRNHLAHGHMYFRIDPETHERKVTVLQAKDLDTGWLPESKHVEFTELQAGLKILDELIEELQRLNRFETGSAPITESS